MSQQIHREESPSDDESAVWNRVLKAALAIPGARIDRASFLEATLSKRFPEETVSLAIESRPAMAGISKADIRSIAKASINRHRAGVSAISFLAGLPGGWWIAGAVPTDLAQFFWHVTVVSQKLAYLYGWPSLSDRGEDLDDETLLVLTVFVGVMLGASASSKILNSIAERLAKEVVVRLPRKALTKYGVYLLAKQVAKWIGIKLTKDTFAKAIAKLVPILGGAISGTISWVTFSIMSKRLRKHLEGLILADPDSTSLTVVE